MKHGFRKIYRCKEYEPLELPVSEFLTEGGGFSFYRDVPEKQLFSVEIGPKGLLLRFSAYIGLIPVSEDVAVLIESRAPIKSVFYLIQRSQSKHFRSVPRLRPYSLDRYAGSLPEHVMAESFVDLLHELRRNGIRKGYTARRWERPIGKFLISASVKAAYSKAMPQKAVFETFGLTTDTFDNRVIKTALSALQKSVDANSALFEKRVARDLRVFGQIFGNINPICHLDTQIIALIRQRLSRLPEKHTTYTQALWLSYMVLFHHEVQLHQIGNASFQSILVNMALVFEDYVRSLVRGFLPSCGAGLRMGDGNVNPIPLFIDRERYNTQPDIYVRRDGKTILIVDVKYKPSIKAVDRYEVIAFMEASGVNDAAIVCPYMGEGPKYELDGRTVSGRQLHILRVDLAAGNLGDEEAWFCRELQGRFLR